MQSRAAATSSRRSARSPTSPSSTCACRGSATRRKRRARRSRTRRSCATRRTMRSRPCATGASLSSSHVSLLLGDPDPRPFLAQLVARSRPDSPSSPAPIILDHVAQPLDDVQSRAPQPDRRPLPPLLHPRCRPPARPDPPRHHDPRRARHPGLRRLAPFNIDLGAAGQHQTRRRPARRPAPHEPRRARHAARARGAVPPAGRNRSRARRCGCARGRG